MLCIQLKKNPFPLMNKYFYGLYNLLLQGRLLYIYTFPQTKTPYLIITAASNHDVISHQQVLSGSKRMDVTKLA